MGPSRYEKKIYIEAIEFTNTVENHQAIKDFTGLPIYIGYTSDGVQLRVIQDPLKVLVAKVEEFIIKKPGSELDVWTRQRLETEYKKCEVAE